MKNPLLAIRLFEKLPSRPIITLSRTMELLNTTKPTALKAISSLERAGVIKETTGKRRDRVYGYREYLQILTKDTD